MINRWLSYRLRPSWFIQLTLNLWKPISTKVGFQLDQLWFIVGLFIVWWAHLSPTYSRWGDIVRNMSQDQVAWNEMDLSVLPEMTWDGENHQKVKACFFLGISVYHISCQTLPMWEEANAEQRWQLFQLALSRGFQWIGWRENPQLFCLFLHFSLEPCLGWNILNQFIGRHTAWTFFNRNLHGNTTVRI